MGLEKLRDIIDSGPQSTTLLLPIYSLFEASSCAHSVPRSVRACARAACCVLCATRCVLCAVLACE